MCILNVVLSIDSPYGPIAMDPASSCLHYALEVCVCVLILCVYCVLLC